jgi:mannosidase alpha-like ER degradation enhancer 2
MTSNKDTSLSDEKFKQLVNESAEGSEASTISNPATLLQENFEGHPKDDEESCNQEVAAVVGNLVGEDAVENLEEGQTQVSTVCDQSTPSPIQGETTSDYRDAATKEVVMEDEPRERGNPSYVRAEDDANQETSKSEEKQKICEIGKSCKTTAINIVLENGHEVLEDKKIHGLENQEEEFPKCEAYGALDTGEAVSQLQSALAVPIATNGREFQKHVLDIASVGVISDPLSAEMEHNVIEITEKAQGGTIGKYVAKKNEEDNFEGGEKSNGIHDFVRIVNHGEEPKCLGPLPILNEEKVQEEVVIEEFAAVMTATSFALQLAEDSVKEDIKPTSSDSNEGTTTSTYEAKTTDTQETMNNSQCDQTQQVLLEELDVVKFENSETLSTCMQLVECSSATELIFPNVSHKEREGASSKDASFTSEISEQKVTGVVAFAAESKQNDLIANADKFSQEHCLVEKPTLGRHAGEETPLLLSAESISSSSYSGEQDMKVVKDIPMTNIALMQAKHEAVEESEKSPLLSPREPSEGAFRAPNQSARNNRPLHSLMSEDRVGRWSLLKEQEPVRKNISSPRSKEKQEPKPSLFALCMCCTTATN